MQQKKKTVYHIRENKIYLNSNYTYTSTQLIADKTEHMHCSQLLCFWVLYTIVRTF
jgi:hypothetical protein